VSATAPYRHFADRRALIAAVAEEGFRSLQQVMLQSMQQADGRRGLKGVALAYVRFAHENPAVYRVMFGPEVANNEDLPSLRETGRSVLRFVGEGIRQLQKSGLVGPGNPDLMAAAIWASLHGLVMLSLDGQTAGVAALDALTEETTRIMMFGMAAR
jgi:AcrR family transcriptional regulator